MSKIKLAFIAVAVVTAVGGAFATRPCAACESQQQYVPYGNTYLPVYSYGVDYVCYTSAGICTYVRESPYIPGSYVPCRYGQFSWIY